MTWFWLAFIAVLCWSGSDLFSKMGSKPDDPYSHWKMVLTVGTVMGVHAIVMLCLGTEFQLRDWLVYFPASALYILAMVLGYAGLRYIELSLSTPICNSSGAVAALLCFVFLGQSMGAVQFVAVGVLCVCIFLLALIEKRQTDRALRVSGVVPERKYTRSALAIAFPILYCIIDGLGTFADAYLLEYHIAEDAANIAFELTFFAMALFAFVYVVLIRKQRFSIPKERPKIIAALFETAGQFAYIYALSANAIVAAPMISSYCVFSLLWARIFLKEKLSPVQYAVIAVAATGIITLGVYDA